MNGADQRVPEVDATVVVAPERIVETTSGPARVLVTNDDGIDAPGIAHLARVLAEEFDVTVAAPDRDRSGAGTGIGHFDPRAGVPMRRVELDGARAYAIDGPPGLAVMAAALGAFGPPFALVVSGINSGINTGQSVIHSGTVGAALTARTFGSHGLALSLAPSDPWHWESAAAIGRAVAEWLCAQSRQPIAVNVNVPGRPLSDVRGLRQAVLDEFGYFRVAIADEGGQKLEFEIASAADRPARAGTDSALVGDGYATVSGLGAFVGTPLSPRPDLASDLAGAPRERRSHLRARR